MAEITVTKDNFEEEVLRADVPVLLDFWAGWCLPCKKLSPVVAELAEKYEGRIKVGKVNVDEEYELADAFRVTSIPLVVVMQDGKPLRAAAGWRPMEQLEAMLPLGGA